MDLIDKRIVLIGRAGLVGSHIVDQLLSEPIGYLDLVQLEKSARIILTNSGGIQKEAYWLSVPCVTLREETEWTVTVKAGWNVLVGADMEAIIRAVRSFKPPVTQQVLYRDKKTVSALGRRSPRQDKMIVSNSGIQILFREIK